AAGSSVLPGAICEHLTSFGGDLREKAGQMPLTEFLRQGAAGASGTVAEPGALQGKFPLPTVHLHYRRGCSLAEAFYQSVACPYQLLIVGDPLCQPWARPPSLSVDGVAPGATVSGVLELTPQVNRGLVVRRRPCEVFVDGRLAAAAVSGKPLRLNTAGLAEGYHELRIVASSADAIEARQSVVLPLEVDNDPRVSLSLTAEPASVDYDQGVVRLTAVLRGWPPRPPADGGDDQTPDAPPGGEGSAAPEAGSPAAATAPSADGGEPATPGGAGAAATSWEVVFRLNNKRLGAASIDPSKPAPLVLTTPAKALGRGDARLSAAVEARQPATPGKAAPGRPPAAAQGLPAAAQGPRSAPVLVSVR
ncbi:MAG: hypothetical protein AAF790_09390, partial [Planctomycetota bacterium]